MNPVDFLLKRLGFYGAYFVMAGGVLAATVGAASLFDRLDEPRQLRRTRMELAKRPLIKNRRRRH